MQPYIPSPYLLMSSDEVFDKMMRTAQYLVNANSFEQQMLWTLFSSESEVPYNIKANIHLHGTHVIETIGTLNDQPVCLDFSTANIEGTTVMFYFACSMTTDMQMMYDWMHKNLEIYRAGKFRVDANNFVKAICFAREQKKLQNLYCVAN